MDRIYTTAVPLKKLRTRIESGIFAVPELQREFVWNARKACDLLDSLYWNYPIGTVLVWKTTSRNEGQLRKHLHILPHYNPTNKEIWFLIDGQQRLSVLWHFLRGQAASVRNADGKQVNFGNVYFNPYSTDGDRLFLYRNRVASRLASQLVPVVDLLSSGWRHRVRAHGSRAFRHLEACRRRILEYEALLVFCETNAKEEVRESFIRINSLGTPIGTADKAFARASKFKMRALVRELQSQLKHGFDRVPRKTILQTTALALDARDLGERAIDAMISKLEKKDAERKRFTRAWPRLRNAFAKATDYLVYELGVPDFSFLPSELMVTILTLFFYYNGNVRPSSGAKQQIRRWFWATSVGARYTGSGYRPNVIGDAAFVQRLASNPNAHASAIGRVPIGKLRYVDYRRPGPVSNAFFCLLRASQPCYLEDGGEIPLGEISSRANRSDKHHIFPKSLLARYGIGPDRANSILNICYLVARENQSVGQRAPRHYFDDVPRTTRARNRSLRSHLIPSKNGSGIWDHSTKRGFSVFLHNRAQLLARAFERQAGVKLFDRD